MADNSQYLQEIATKLEKALVHLEYSYNKVQDLPLEDLSSDEETLETWESFDTRFARVADIFLTRYLRTAITIDDPGFQGINQQIKESKCD